MFAMQFYFVFNNCYHRKHEIHNITNIENFHKESNYLSHGIYLLKFTAKCILFNITSKYSIQLLTKAGK